MGTITDYNTSDTEAPTLHNFKDGDWCYYELNLVHIVKVHDGGTCTINDGIFEIYSPRLDGECFPITFEIRDITERFNDAYKAFVNSPESAVAVLSSIKRWVVDKWVEACNEPGNRSKVDKIILEVVTFFKEAKIVLKRVTDINVRGFEVVAL